MKDPRILHKQFYSLENIVFITIIGVMSGCESWDDIKDYGKSKIEWLKSFLNVANDVPSHNTFNRFFSIIRLHRI